MNASSTSITPFNEPKDALHNNQKQTNTEKQHNKLNKSVKMGGKTF